MRILPRTVAVLAFALPLWGCLLVTYKGPTEGPAADLAIHNRTGRLMAVHLYEDSAECRNRQTLMPITKAGQTRDIKVSAARPTTITLSQDVSATMGCVATFTFKPVDGHGYEATFRTGSTGCTVALVDRTAGTTVDFDKRVWKTAFDEHGPFCDAGVAAD